MADRPWKQFERDIGKLIGGTRFWANSGESVDCEGPLFLAQCKNVKSMSLNAIADLAYQIAEDGKNRKARKMVRLDPRLSSMPFYAEMLKQGKLDFNPTPLQPDPKMGILALRTRPGRGKKSKTVIVMTEEVFKQFYPTGG